MERFYEDKIMAGFLTYEQAKAKIVANTPIDFADADNPRTIPLYAFEIDHLVRHMALWDVRERRITRYQKQGRHEEAKALSEIYRGLEGERE
jgi:hypothetical protein